MVHIRQVVNKFIKCVSLCVSEQRDQEEVRKRFASISYSDPFYWDRPGAAGKKNQLVNPLSVFREMISLMSPVGGDSATTDKNR